jgi:xylulose-5-phosphate/fructose-6-phosphate phosphoketolase
MILIQSPNGWTGPKDAEGAPIDGTFHPRQVPLRPNRHPENLELLEDWMRSCRLA